MLAGARNINTHNNLLIEGAAYTSCGLSGRLEIEASDDVLNKIWLDLNEISAETRAFYHEALNDYLQTIANSIAVKDPNINSAMGDWGEFVEVTVQPPTEGKMIFELNADNIHNQQPEATLDYFMWITD